MLKRILPVIVTVSILLSCVIVSASAAEIYQYEDHISRIVQDPSNSENVLVYVNLPLNVCWEVVDQTTGETWNYSGDSIEHYVAQGHKYTVWVSSFGAAVRWPTSWSGDVLDISTLPASTQIQQVLYCDFNGGIVLNGLSARSYYGNTPTTVHSPASQYVFQETGDGYLYTFNIPEGYKYFFTQQYFTDVVAQGSADMVMTFKSSTLVISLNELYFEYQQTGANKELLQAIEKKIESNGQTLQDVLDQQVNINDKLDDMINGEVNGTPPEGSDIVDDYQSAEDQLMDSVEGGSSEFDDVSMTAWDRLYTYQQSFLAFSYLFNLFADIPFFQSLLYISLTLGSVVFLLGIGAAAARYEERHHTAAGQRRRRG